jgi:hypothetical protein
LTSMNEIICPECGRPNLTEAEKCWYCQILLVKNKGEDNQQDESSDTVGDCSAVENTKDALISKEEPAEDLPGWLKRIRELKKADQPVEEVDQWQQEKLFTGLAQEKGKPADHTDEVRRPIRTQDEPAPKPIVPEGQPLLEEAPKEEKTGDMDESESVEPDHPDDELPEGFTPLKTGSN